MRPSKYKRTQFKSRLYIDFTILYYPYQQRIFNRWICQLQSFHSFQELQKQREALKALEREKEETEWGSHSAWGHRQIQSEQEGNDIVPLRNEIGLAFNRSSSKVLNGGGP